MKLFNVTYGLILINNKQPEGTLCYILENNRFNKILTKLQKSGRRPRTSPGMKIKIVVLTEKTKNQ